MKNTAEKISYLTCFAALVTIDQISKWYIFEIMLRTQGQRRGFLDWMSHKQAIGDTLASLADFSRIEVTPFFNLVAVWNTGVSFGLLQDSSAIMPLLLTIFSLLMVMALLVWGFKTTSGVEKWSSLLIAGGALGNALDRMRFKAVADFLDFHYGAFHWPAFNVADTAIVLGAVLLIVYILFGNPKQQIPGA